MKESQIIEGTVFSIERFSLHDGPGIRTTVFLKGCPLSCIWCHNPEGRRAGPQLRYFAQECIGCMACVQACPNGVHTFTDGVHRVDFSRCKACRACENVCVAGALRVEGHRMSAEAVISEVLKDRIYYGEEGGLTISGGEPLLQTAFCVRLARLAKENGISVCVETAGDVPREALEAMRDCTDLFLYDYKMSDEEKLRRYTGGNLGRILDNLAYLAAHQARVVLRCPIICGINDDDGHFRAIAALSQRLGIREVELMPYHNYGKGKWEQIGEPYALADMETVSKQEGARMNERLHMFLEEAAQGRTNERL